MKRCSKKNDTYGLRCLLDDGHTGNHKYVPKGLLCPTSLTKILLELTSGEIKSQAGLDNITTIKGHENFKNMKSMIDNFTGIIEDYHSREEGEALKKEIDWVIDWHKVGFIQHLGKGSSKCTCLKCGFYDEEKDPIHCESKNRHTPPCFECQRTFKVKHSIHLFHDSGIM